MKKVLAFILCAVMAVLVVGCGSSAETDLQDIKDKGELVVGITEYAPMDYKDDNGNWIGFDADFATAFAEELGVKVKFVVIDWDNKFPELNSKSIDCVWNGMTITDEVTKNTSCSKAYAKNEQVVVMKEKDSAKYKDAESMSKLSFAVESGSAGESAAKDNKFKFTSLAAQSDALMEVESGSSDACIIDSTMATAMTGEGTSYKDLAQSITLTKEEYGVGFRKGSNMTEEFNKFYDKAKKDGTLQKISDKYQVALAD